MKLPSVMKRTEKEKEKLRRYRLNEKILPRKAL